MEDLPKIKVIGIGGAGCRLVDKTLQLELGSAEFYAVDDDSVTMERLQCENKILLECGDRIAGDCGLCEKTAKENKERLNGIVKGADMVILVAGAGGGFASAVAPLIAETAKENEILTLAAVCSPLMSEEKVRQENADRCISALKEIADTAIIVPCGNGKLLSPFKLPEERELMLADAMVESALLTVIMPSTVPAVLNVEFSDLISVLKESGKVYFGVGAYRGKDRAVSAVQAAMDCPLSANFPDGANRLLILVESGELSEIDEIRQISDYLTSALNSSAQIIFSVHVNESLGENMKVSVLATKRREDKREVNGGKLKQRNENGFSAELNKVLEFAGEYSQSRGCTYTSTEDLVYAMLVTESIAGRILVACGIDFISFVEYLNKLTDTECRVVGDTLQTKFVIDKAKQFARETDGDGAEVGTEHLLLAIASFDQCIAMRALRKLGVDTVKLNGMLERVTGIK